MIHIPGLAFPVEEFLLEDVVEMIGYVGPLTSLFLGEEDAFCVSHIFGHLELDLLQSYKTHFSRSLPSICLCRCFMKLFSTLHCFPMRRCGLCNVSLARASPRTGMIVFLYKVLDLSCLVALRPAEKQIRIAVQYRHKCALLEFF